MDEQSNSKFTCKECGGHKLIVTHVWNILAGPDSERWQEWGPLMNNHHWKYEFKEKVDAKPADETERGDFSDFVEDDSASEPEDFEIYEPSSNQEDDEFFVNCEGCDREIKFGWSKPDRRGHILPVEFSDFVQAESWPDPKYLGTWQHSQ